MTTTVTKVIEIVTAAAEEKLRGSVAQWSTVGLYITPEEQRAIEEGLQYYLRHIEYHDRPKYTVRDVVAKALAGRMKPETRERLNPMA